jgi:hypothetical protein
MIQSPRPRLKLGLITLTAALPAAIGIVVSCQSDLDPVDLRQDQVPPQVSLTTPTAGAEGVSTQSTITVTFNEAMDPASFHAGTFRVEAEGSPVSGLIVGLGRRFTFDPESELDAGLIEVTLAGVADMEGNTLRQPYQFSFTTEPSIPPPPEPVNPTPADGATNVPVDATFSWDVGDPSGIVFDFLLGTSVDDLQVIATDILVENFEPGTLPFNTQHFWQIVARSDAGETQGDVWSFTTRDVPPPPNDPPSAPAPPITPPHRAVIQALEVDLTWSEGDDPDGDPVTYDVYFGTNDEELELVATVTQKAHHIDDLQPVQRYYWQIVAKDDHDHQVAGDVWRFDTSTGNRPPDAACNPSPSSGSENLPTTIQLTWGCGSDPDGDPVTYHVFLERNDNTPDQEVATVTTPSYSASNLNLGEDYYWRIEARDNRGGATMGPVWSFETTRAPTAPCNPMPPDNAILVPTTVKLEWSCGIDPDGDDVVYDVYLGNTPDPPLLDTTENRSYETNVEALQTYYWRIGARDEHGAVRFGQVWSFTTGLLRPAR